MNKRILLIVEGPNDEKSLVEKLWDRFDREGTGMDFPDRKSSSISA